MALRDGWMESSRDRNGHAQSGGRVLGDGVGVGKGHQVGTRLLARPADTCSH